jgi:uncharacterized protein
MSKPLPALLDPLKATANGELYQGSVPLGEMPRLVGIDVDAGCRPSPHSADAQDDRRPGGAAYSLRFFRDDTGRDVIAGRVRAQLKLRCQRCAEIMTLTVDSGFKLAVVAGLEEAKRLPADYEPLLPEESLIRPRDLIEDELILAVPIVPRHVDGQCMMPSIGRTEQPGQPTPAARNPFAELSVLKERAR